MTMNRFSAVLCINMIMVAGAACDGTNDLRGQSNTTFTFYGQAVDQDGRIVAGAEFAIDVEAIPAGWTFETRGKPHVHSTVTVKSGPDGRFAPQLTGHILRFEQCTQLGYRHLYDLEQGSGEPGENMFYAISAWSNLSYRTDPDHPAVFVFVKDGVTKVSALPCRGGYDPTGFGWRRNEPGWPRKPSLNNVVYVGPEPTPSRVVISKPATPDPRASEFTFYGMAVDQAGKPLGGAKFDLWVEQVWPRAWEVPVLPPGFDARVIASARVESGPDGKFQATGTGRAITVQGARFPNYIPLYDQSPGPSPTKNNRYCFDPTRAERYRSDPDHPAIFVFVERGVLPVSAKPSRGGYDTQDGGKTWTPTPPTWPKLPSIQGAFYREAGAGPDVK